MSRNKLLCSHLTRLHAGEKQPCTHHALLEEISPEAAVLSVECPVRRGTNVRIDCRNCELRGKVVGCRHWVSGYLAEVEFEPGGKWVAADFKPDRLFNPHSLVCTNPGCRSDCVNASCAEGKALE